MTPSLAKIEKNLNRIRDGECRTQYVFHDEGHGHILVKRTCICNGHSDCILNS